MKKRQGFTLIELLVVVAIIALLIGILLPSLSRAREVANRTVSASNLSGIYKALYQYSISNDDNFPKYRGDDTDAVGFQADDGGLRGTQNPDLGSGGNLYNNVTASLWKLVKEGSVAAKQYTNPSDKGASADELTDNSDNTVPLSTTWDFWAPENLSYSPINMYDQVAGRSWSSKVKPDYVIMGDDNNADDENNGGTSMGFHQNTMQGFNGNQTNDEGIQNHENSQNHSQGEGQNFMFGDGHVEFENHPFVGRNQDNAMALTTNDMPVGSSGNPANFTPTNTAPSLSNSGEGSSSVHQQNREFDSVLIPVTGNEGDNLDPNSN